MTRSNKRFQLVEKLVGKRIIDLLFHVPHQLVYRHFVHDLNYAYPGELATLKVHVLSHVPRGSQKQPYRVLCALTTDNQAQKLTSQELNNAQKIELCYFHASPEFLKRLLPAHSLRMVSGRLEKKMDVWTMAHPDHVGSVSELPQWAGYEPVYPLAAGVTQTMIRGLVQKALTMVPYLPEWIDQSLMTKMGWPSWRQALHWVHGVYQDSAANFNLEAFNLAKARLSYDELLAYQIPIQMSYTDRQVIAGPVFQPSRFSPQVETIKPFIETLPFKLTQSQHDVLGEIFQNMASGHQMHRLLQGDVGSGKTIVAFLALVHGVKNGYQGALLAPTDILARQHFQTLCNFNQSHGLNIQLITGKDTLKERRVLLEALKEGKIDLLVGTHALIQSGVEFKRLGISVIDEQHRFGVDQRLALTAKGSNPHMLVMSATPIPRTIMLSNYGNLDVSILKEKPAGRKPIDTKILSLEKTPLLLKSIKAQINSGEKIYWICPLVEESQVSDLAAATQRYEELNIMFPGLVGLVHGKMKPQEKESAMASFINGETRLLVATSVIEVGVDVPDATIMIIEHAERFGLAQLHQLRGRIGRGEKDSVCILLYGQPLSNMGKERLKTMKQTNDGFFIAEQDLKLRGGGDTLGRKQSGLPAMRIADFLEHESLLNIAFNQAKQEMKYLQANEDNKGSSLCTIIKPNSPLHILLSLFEKEEALKYIRSG